MFRSQYSAFTPIPTQKSNATDNTISNTIGNLTSNTTVNYDTETNDAITDNMSMENNIHTPIKIIEQNDFPKPQEINQDNSQNTTNHMGNNTTDHSTTHATNAEPERWCICEYIC
jgi:hypothetical protein